MNYYKSCDILELSSPFTDKELRHSYYTKALKYHPDKNTDEHAKDRFQEILEAYNYLNNHYKFEYKPLENSYFSILEKFINDLTDQNIDIKQFLSILNNKYTDISIELLKKCSKDVLLKFHIFIKQYGDILHINEKITNTLNQLVNDHIKDDTIIKIIPSLENLINDEIYKLSFKDEIYYIPMWHHELVYDISDSSLIIQCEPTIPDYITLDNYNNLYINLSMTLYSILNQESITINIINNQYTIPVNQLYIKKYQQYILKKGIALIDTNNIYNVENRANIYIQIQFTDIS